MGILRRHVLRVAALLLVIGLTFAIRVERALAVSCTDGTLSAYASIIASAGTVDITLANISACDTDQNRHVLQGLFWTYEGPTLTPESAVVADTTPDSLLTNVPNPPESTVGGEGTDIGGGWAYGTGMVINGNSVDGIKSAGYGVGPGQGNFGCGSGCLNLDGGDYGILSIWDNLATPSSGEYNNKDPLIKWAALFTLSYDAQAGAPKFSNIFFTWGTALDGTDPCLGSCQPTTVPEPSSLLLLGSGLLIGAVIIRRKWAGRG